MRKLLVLLLCALAIFAAVSCKNDPKVEPQPEESYQIVRLTASKGRADGWNSYDKFELLFTTSVKKDDVVSVTYRATRPIDQFNVRVNTTTNGDHRWVYEQDKSKLTSYDDSDPNGWITATYKFSDYADRVSGDKEKHEMTDELYAGVSDFFFHFRGNIVAGDFMEIKEVLWNGNPVDISTVAKAALGKSGDVVQDEKNVEVIDSKDSTWKKDLVTYYVMFYADPTQHKDGKPEGTNYENSDYLTGIGVAVKSGDKVAKPADPTREGYTFGGWCKEKTYDGTDATKIWDFDKDTVTENKMLYAIWTAAAQPVAKIAKAVVTKTYADDKDNYDRIRLNFPSTVLKNGSKITFKFRTTRPFDYGVSLRALDTDGFKVLYYDDIDDVVSETPDADKWYSFSYTMGDKTSAAAGKKVEGVYTPQDVNYEKFADGFYLCLHGFICPTDFLEIKDFAIDDTPIDITKVDVKDGSLTLVDDHEWTAPETRVVAFFTQRDREKDGKTYTDYEKTVVNETKVVAKGGFVTSPDVPKMNGYVFAGWSTSRKAAEQTTAVDLSTTAVNSNTRYYAIWKPDTTYKITPNAEGNRIQIKWADLKLKAGDEISITYKTDIVFTQYTTRTIGPTEVKWVNSAAFADTAVDGWYTSTYKCPEGADGTGFGLSLFANATHTTDEFLIKTMTINGIYMGVPEAYSCDLTIAALE